MKKTLLLVFIFTCQCVWGVTFTIPVLPDTQCEVNSKPEMFSSQINWIAANKTALNIPIVLHVGDIVDWDTEDHSPWKTASEGFKVLDEAGIPYALAVGNHDTAAVKKGGSAAPGDTHANVRITTQFNTFFPPGRFTTQRGRYQPEKSDNAWYTFNAGGLKWLVLALELWPRQEPLDWAKSIVESHPDYNVIILTHAYLTSGGKIQKNNGGYGDLSPQAVFDQLISQYPNILLVLSGHVGTSARREDAGVHGNRIDQILQDYQGQDYGGGYIRLLEFDTEARTIAARMYSPYYDETKEDNSMFTLSDVNFVQSSGTPASEAPDDVLSNPITQRKSP